MKTKKRQRTRCAMCDSWYYEDDAEEAKVHAHPEPQGGAFRTAWFNSKLSYDQWIEKTEEGKAWVKHIRQRRRVHESDRG